MSIYNYMHIFAHVCYVSFKLLIATNYCYDRPMYAVCVFFASITNLLVKLLVKLHTSRLKDLICEYGYSVTVKESKSLCWIEH